MANDSMRGGPRGSSDQAALLRPITVQLASYGGVNPELDESGTTDADLLRLWAPFDGDTAGYKVKKVFIVVSETYGATGTDFKVGTYTYNVGTGNYDAVDDDAFVTLGQNLANGTKNGALFELDLDGAGAGLDPTLTDPDNSNYLIGGSDNQFLGIKAAGSSGGAGKVVCYAELIPVSGTYYSN